MTWSLALLSPVVDTGCVDIAMLIEAVRPPRSTIQNHFLRDGPASIETKADEEACLPDLRRLASALDAGGYDAIIVNCALDPGVDELQQRLSTPVLGPAKTAMHVAAMLGQRFSFLDVVAEARDDMLDLAARYGLADAVASHRAIGAHVLDVQTDPEGALRALEEQAILAMEHDGAKAVVLACTLFATFARPLSAKLAARGFDLPVIEPLAATAALACVLLDAGMLARLRP